MIKQHIRENIPSQIPTSPFYYDYDNCCAYPVKSNNYNYDNCYTPKCSSICSIDNVNIPDCADIFLDKEGIVKLSFDECDFTLRATFDVNEFLYRDIYRAGTGIRFEQLYDRIRNHNYIKIHNDTSHFINGIKFKQGYNNQDNWYNFNVISKNKSIQITKAIDEDCEEGGYVLNLESQATSLANSLTFKDLDNFNDKGCEISNTGGTIELYYEGFDISCDTNKVFFKQKSGTLASINGVGGVAQNVELISTNNSIDITPNNTNKTVDLKVNIISSDTSVLSVTQNANGDFVLNPVNSSPVQWVDFAPSLQATTNPTTLQNTRGQYKIINQDLCYVNYNIIIDNPGSGDIKLVLPINSSPLALRTILEVVYYDSSTATRYKGFAELVANSSTADLYVDNGAKVNQTTPFAFASDDQIWVNGQYRI